jgi:hypothetical protein
MVDTCITTAPRPTWSWTLPHSRQPEVQTLLCRRAMRRLAPHHSTSVRPRPAVRRPTTATPLLPRNLTPPGSRRSDAPSARWSKVTVPLTFASTAVPCRTLTGCHGGRPLASQKTAVLGADAGGRRVPRRCSWSLLQTILPFLASLAGSRLAGERPCRRTRRPEKNLVRTGRKTFPCKLCWITDVWASNGLAV